MSTGVQPYEAVQYVIEIHYFLLEMTLSNSWVRCVLVAIKGGLLFIEIFLDLICNRLVEFSGNDFIRLLGSSFQCGSRD